MAVERLVEKGRVIIGVKQRRRPPNSVMLSVFNFGSDPVIVCLREEEALWLAEQIRLALRRT